MVCTVERQWHMADQGVSVSPTASTEERLRSAELEARALAISKNVRCTECGHQSIEESGAEVAILLRRIIRSELKKGRSEKEVFQKLEEDYGEAVLYAPPFDAQTALLWLLPVIGLGAAAGMAMRGRRPPPRAQALMSAERMLARMPLTAGERAALQRLLQPPRGRQAGW